MVSVRLVPTGPVHCGSQAWRAQEKNFITVVVKATFAFDAQGAGSVVSDTDAVLHRDEHYEKNPTKSVRDCSDLAPYLNRAEVLLRGSAHPRGGQRAIARLIVGRPDATLLDRTFIVQPAPGSPSVNLTCENAVGGPGHLVNP